MDDSSKSPLPAVHVDENGVPTLEALNASIEALRSAMPLAVETREFAALCLEMMYLQILEEKYPPTKPDPTVNYFNWAIAAEIKRLCDSHGVGFKEAFVALCPNLNYDKDGPIAVCYRKINRDEAIAEIPPLDRSLVAAAENRISERKKRKLS